MRIAFRASEISLPVFVGLSDELGAGTTEDVDGAVLV